MNEYMERNSVPHLLRRRVREYLYHSNFTQQAAEDGAGFNRLSPTLRSDVILASPSYSWLLRVWIFHDTEIEFVVTIPHCMSASVYAPFELPERGRLYILHKGVVMKGGLILTSGRWWGEDVIVRDEAHRKPVVARALTFVETYSIDRSTLFNLAAPFPATLQKLRLRCAQLEVSRAHAVSARLHSSTHRRMLRPDRARSQTLNYAQGRHPCAHTKAVPRARCAGDTKPREVERLDRRARFGRHVRQAAEHFRGACEEGGRRARGCATRGPRCAASRVGTRSGDDHATRFNLRVTRA